MISTHRIGERIGPCILVAKRGNPKRPQTHFDAKCQLCGRPKALDRHQVWEMIRQKHCSVACDLESRRGEHA